MKRIYLDYASLTPMDPRVIREVKKYSSAKYANPSSLYMEGVVAKKVMEEGRKKVADFLHAHSDEIVFTSGGTEANGLALEGVLKDFKKQRSKDIRWNDNAKPHLIISSIEHSSIMETANMLEKHGVEVTRLSVDSRGIVSLDELKKAIKPNTFMVSIMMVNNEVGSIQPIKEAVKIVRQARKTKVAGAADSNAGANDPKYPLFHTDAAQALYEDLNLESLGVDLLTLDGGKVYGPRGIGCLFVRKGTPIEPIIYGGGQERGMRSGTENVPAIVGFGKALEIASHGRMKEAAKIAELKAIFSHDLESLGAQINGDKTSPHILNVSIPGIDNEFFVLQLDARGVACSTKSSCLRDADESYVLKAMTANRPDSKQISKTSVRFSFGRYTKKGHIKKAAKIIAGILHRG